jgi:hypothetical protein
MEDKARHVIVVVFVVVIIVVVLLLPPPAALLPPPARSLLDIAVAAAMRAFERQDGDCPCKGASSRHHNNAGNEGGGY